MSQTNVASDAIQNNLTIKQELFARGVANGLSLSEAARQAGYQEANQETPALPARMLRNEKIQNRIGVLIGQKDFESQAANTWAYLFSIDVSEFEPGGGRWSNIVDKKLRAIEQIAKLAGWEPNKTVETKSLVLRGDLSEILPK